MSSFSGSGDRCGVRMPPLSKLQGFCRWLCYPPPISWHCLQPYIPVSRSYPGASVLLLPSYTGSFRGHIRHADGLALTYVHVRPRCPGGGFDRRTSPCIHSVNSTEASPQQASRIEQRHCGKRKSLEWPSCCSYMYVWIWTLQQHWGLLSFTG